MRLSTRIRLAVFGLALLVGFCTQILVDVIHGVTSFGSWVPVMVPFWLLPLWLSVHVSPPRDEVDS